MLDEEVVELLDVVYVTPTKKQIEDIKKIVEERNTSSGNAICDYLGIQRRENRTNLNQKLMDIYNR